MAHVAHDNRHLSHPIILLDWHLTVILFRGNSSAGTSAVACTAQREAASRALGATAVTIVQPLSGGGES